MLECAFKWFTIHWHCLICKPTVFSFNSHTIGNDQISYTNICGCRECVKSTSWSRALRWSVESIINLASKRCWPTKSGLTSWSNSSFSAFISEFDTEHIFWVLSTPTGPYQELNMLNKNNEKLVKRLSLS